MARCSHRAAPACALQLAEVSSARGVAPKEQRRRSSASGVYVSGRAGGQVTEVCSPQNAWMTSRGVMRVSLMKASGIVSVGVVLLS
jgi:hypothetical protein